MDQSVVGRGYIVALCLDRLAASGPVLTLTFSSSLELAGGEYRVRFEQVSDLRVLELNAFHFSIVIAEDVGHWQNECVKYFVSDSENEVISFKCQRWSASA